VNKLEKIIHNALDEFPRLKRIVRDSYQLFFYVIPSADYAESEVTIREGYFFGFHDKRPWCYDDSMLLSHRLHDESLKRFRMDRPVDIGYFTGEKFQDFVRLCDTSSWNYQQGAMLQWVGNSKKIIFNDFNGSRNIAKIIGIEGRQEGELQEPVATVSPDGEKALSYSFERLRIGMPGYEYYAGNRKREAGEAPDNDGLFLVDINSSTIKLLFSLADIVKYRPQPEFGNAYHFITHCLFSPNGKRLVFFHRWIRNDRVSFTRMISCDPNGDDMHLFPTDNMVSHISWFGDSHVIAYANTKLHGANYYIFADKQDDASLIDVKIFSGDGHPQVSPDGRWMVTDSYPDRKRMQSLFLYDCNNNTARKILSCRIPFRYRNEFRCDFHPRWNYGSSMISFDSAQTGTRSHCTISPHF